MGGDVAARFFGESKRRALGVTAARDPPSTISAVSRNFATRSRLAFRAISNHDKCVTLDEQFATFLARDPTIDPSAYIARGTTLIGDVRIGPRASVWPGCVLRGDINFIEVGESTNLQDGTIVHLADQFPVRIGRFVTVGHGALLHACTVEDECLIGMRATILDGAVIGRNSILGAQTLITQRTFVPPGSLVVGVPGKVVRTLEPAEQAGIRRWAEKYLRVAEAHRRRAS